MEGIFHLHAQGGGSIKREPYQARYEDHAQHQHQQSYNTLRRSRSTPEDSAVAAAIGATGALPGFATFLQQSPPPPPRGRHERSRFAPSRPEPLALSVESLARPQPRDSYDHQRQPALMFSDRLMNTLARNQSQMSATSEMSCGSPNTNGFKHITINGTPPTSQPSSYRTASRSQASSESARTRTNYKPQASNIGSLTLSQQQQQQRPPARTSRYLREVDRREILRRIEQGEKQANLAKEYQVSRAAISNLKQRRNNRNRKDVLQDRREASDPKERGLSESDAGNYSQHLQQPSGQLTQERFVFSDTSHAESHLQIHSPLSSDGYHDKRYDSTNEHAQTPSPVSSLSTLSPFRDSEILSPIEDESQDRVVEVKTATTELLFTRLVDLLVDVPTMQAAKSRIARLLLEAAMSEFPTRDLQIPLGSSLNSSRLSAMSSTASCYLGIEFAKPTCAVKIVSAGCKRDGAVDVLLHEFQQIEPFSEVGSISFSSNLSRPRPGVALPQNVHESNVLLLVDFLDSQSSDKIAHALQAILRAGIQQRDVLVVTICSHERALRELLEQFLHLRVITAKVLLTQSDSGVSPSGVADLLHSRLCFQQ